MNVLNGHDIEDLSVGMVATFAKTITEADIVLFAGASGDNNAVHINEEFAQTTRHLGGDREQAARAGDDLSQAVARVQSACSCR